MEYIFFDKSIVIAGVFVLATAYATKSHICLDIEMIG